MDIILHPDVEMTWPLFQDRLYAYKQSWLSSNTPISVTEMILRPGKQWRAQLVFLTAQLLGLVTEEHVLLAGAIECLHTASLLHDDVLDNGYMRRGGECMHRVWGNAVAILSGDWWLSKSLALLLEISHRDVRKGMQKAMDQLVQGQILDCQMSVDVQAIDYLQMIRDKTACLFGIAASLSAVISNAPSESVKILEKYGLSMGMAYQLRDDADEYAMSPEKWNIGHDFVQKKVTYPWMLLRDTTASDQWAYIIDIQKTLYNRTVQEGDTMMHSDQTGKTVICFFQQIYAFFQHSVQETYALAERYKKSSLPDLHRLWTDSELSSLLHWGQAF